MNLFKKIIAVASILAIMLTFCACHPKNEVAYEIEGIKFTSAYYMCALIEADLNAKSKVESENSDASDTSTEIDYYSQKIDGKKFVTYVKEQAEESLKEIAFYKSMCQKNKLEIEDSVSEYTKSYVDYYWSQGMSTYYEPNGVSKATFVEYSNDSSYKELYFNFIYGEKGSKEISADDIKQNMLDNYQIADIIEVDLSSSEDEEKASLSIMFNKYATDLKNKTRTFEAVLNEYNDYSGNTSSSKNDDAKDPYATILGADSTSYSNSNYSTVKDMSVGEVKLLEPDDGASITLIVKQDIASDEYYLETLDSTIRHALKDEEFEEETAKSIKSVDFKEYTKATKRFKVKNIEYPSTQS